MTIYILLGVIFYLMGISFFHSKTLIPNFKLKLIVGEESNIVSISDEIKQQLDIYLNKYIGIEKGGKSICLKLH